MALNLKKGGRFNLSKQAPGLKSAGIGLGWNPNEEPDGPDFDLDVSAFLLDASGKVPTEDYVVFFNSERKVESAEGMRPISGDGSVWGAVDSLTGGEKDGGDEEDMRLYLDKVWEGITEIVITVTITKYPSDKNRDRRTLLQNFGMVEDCYIRVWDEDSGDEILKYSLQEKFTSEDAVEFGRFIRVDGTWEFIATTKAYTGGLQKFIDLLT